MNTTSPPAPKRRGWLTRLLDASDETVAELVAELDKTQAENARLGERLERVSRHHAEAGEEFRDELGHSKSSYLRGTVAMANSGPNTNGSQFFIMHADYGLPNQYSIFGQVTDGIEVVDQIAAAATGMQDRPVSPVTIDSISITES